MTFEHYDMKRIEEAKNLLRRVYDSNYGDSALKQAEARLVTIIRKIDSLINTQEGNI